MGERSAARTPQTRSEERRQQVLQAAFAAITERGIPDTRMTDIAERAGMSPGHMLYYFRSKTHILAELLRWNEDWFHERIQARLPRAKTAREQIVYLIRASAPDGRGDPHWLLWMEVWAMAPHDPELLAGQELQERRFQDVLARVIGEGQASGEFDGSVDATEAAARLSALLDGLAIHVAIGAPGADRRSMIRIATDEAASLLGFDQHRVP